MGQDMQNASARLRRPSAFAWAGAFGLGLALLACETAPDTDWSSVAPADELYADGLAALKGRSILGVYRYVDYEKVIETFQALIDNYPYSDQAVDAELQIANAYFESARYEEALTYYRDFAELHPNHPKVPYTIYRSALCHEEQLEDVQRDQRNTRQAIEFLDRLLVAYPNSAYAKEAEALWRRLHVHLAEHVEGIADFYRSREEYEAAAERYRSILNDSPGFGLDARVLFKLAECYQKLRRLDEADRIYRTLVFHYGESPWAFRARQRIASNLNFD